MKNWINNKIVELQMRAATDEGQGTVEYAVVLGVIVVGIVGAFIIADVGSVIGLLVDEVENLIP